MTVAVAVMHAPWDAQRRAWLPQIVRGVAPLKAQVVPDQTRAGVWPTARRAWRTLMLDNDADHACVLQDDVLPMPDFAKHVDGMLQAQPDAVIALWTPDRFAFEVQAHWQAWFRTSGVLYGPGIVMPRAWIPDLLRWQAQHVKPDWGHSDTRVSLWATATKRRVVVAVPSVIRHLGNGHSLLGHDDPELPGIVVQPRGAVDWSAGAADPMWQPRPGSGTFAQHKWPGARLERISLKDAH